MTYGIKELRSQKGMTRAELAEKLKVDVKTIYNWEKFNPIIPSLNTMREIAFGLGITTYEVYNAFMSEKAEPSSDFVWNDHRDDFKKGSGPYQLFNYIKMNRLDGEGFVIYRHKLFRYASIRLHDAHKQNESISSLEDMIKNSFIPCDGLVLTDEAANSIIITVKEVQSWRTIEVESDHTVFEINTTTAFFPEMEEEICTVGVGSFYLNAYVHCSEEKLPYTKPIPPEIIVNTDNILGRYIRVCRERDGLTQQQLAEELNIFGVRASKSTINRWEAGDLQPSAYDFGILHIYFKVSAEKILDAYHNGLYVSSAIDENGYCYETGIHYLFSRIEGYESFLRFIKQYEFYEKTLDFGDEIIGSLLKDEIETKIMDVKIKHSEVHFLNESGEAIIINEENLIEVIPYSLHCSAYYEIHVRIRDNTDDARYSVILRIW